MGLSCMHSNSCRTKDILRRFFMTFDLRQLITPDLMPDSSTLRGRDQNICSHKIIVSVLFNIKIYTNSHKPIQGLGECMQCPGPLFYLEIWFGGN